MRRFEFIKQRDSMQCGIACLCMIANYFGRFCSIQQVEQVCHANSEGVSLKGISDGANQLGLKAKGAKVKTEDLYAMPLPAILHWNQNHFVVLYKIKSNGKFLVADPAIGLVEYKSTELESHWICSGIENEKYGIAMFFDKDISFNGTLTTHASKESAISFILEYFSKYRKYFVHVFCGLIIGCLLQLIMPCLTQSIVDVGIAHQDLHFIWLILLGELLIVLGGMTTGFIRRWITLHISIRINLTLVSNFFIKLLNLPMGFFDMKLLGDLLQRMSDHSRIQNFLTTDLLNMSFNILSFLILSVALFFYSSTILLTFLGGSILYCVWISYFLTKREHLDYELFERQAIGQNLTYQFVSYMQEIKLQGCEQRRRREWEDSQAAIYRVQMKAMKLQQAQEAGSIFINEVKNILITVLAATAVIKGQMTLGAMVAVQYIIGQLNSPVERFMAFIYSLQDVKISLDRINEIHQGHDEEDGTNNHTSYHSTKSIGIKAINFKYDPHALEMTLENLSLEIPEGKVTAIVGASGSGKTTLLKLILGYYPVINGCIEIAGRKIADYNPRWWRSRCGVVMQDGVIFSESIARNIAVDDGPIDTERLKEAARIAHIHDYILGLPLRYDTKIGRDGVGLSQGQKQRILIARAVYKNPDFIFLDEATNALDAKNERLIVEELEGFYQGRTVVVVAHRLSTVKNADKIVVLEHGRIAETGTHLSLIAKRGVYYNLVKNQLELGN